jgi:Leucine-rich repeat (LRR) protein
MNKPEITGFEILEKLGTGGMATVWKARQLSLDRIVAIKVLGGGIGADAEAVQMFQSEAQAAAKLKHSSIIQVYDANMENGCYYFVMEYVAGYTIGEWLRRKGRLPEKEALVVAECVAEALDYAWHKEGIIHCDIKPDNVMIDADGTVKVADLGLARTINAMRSEELPDEVMGTPAYISPEQATGATDLDCRSDIYSLGAMLFHLCTGHMLFEGLSEDDVMEMQVNGFAEDPLAVNPEMSVPVCWLIEKMLAKHRSKRQSDWQGVTVDLARVKRGKLPTPPLPRAGDSTVKRSASRTAAHRAKRRNPAQQRTGPEPRLPLAVWALIAFVVIGAALVLSALPRRARPPVSSRPAVLVHPEPPARETDAPAMAPETAASDLYEQARQWERDNPGKQREAMERYRDVTTRAQGTRVAMMAAAEARRLRRVMLQQEREARRRREEAQADARRREEMVQLAEARCDQALDEVARVLFEQGAFNALDIAHARQASLQDGPGVNRLREVASFLADAMQVDEAILRTFEEKKGGSIDVLLKTGRKTVVVEDVRGGIVYGRQETKHGNHVASIAVTFGVKDLHERERLDRMGGDGDPAVALMKGLMALEAGAYEHAERYFGDTHPSVKDRLLALLRKNQEYEANEKAEDALRDVLAEIGVQVAEFDAERWAEAVERTKSVPAETSMRVRAFVEGFRSEYGDTAFGRRANPVLRALNTMEPGSQDGRQAVDREEPVDMRPLAEAVRNPVVDNVVRGLMQSNPQILVTDIQFGFQGPVPVRIDVISPGIADIRALSQLRTLRDVSIGAVRPHQASGRQPHAPLADISPLGGLPLESVYLGLTAVKDLSVLKGMPLKRLSVPHTLVTDLAPLRQAALRVVNLAGTPVRHVDALRGMPLVSLDLSDTRIMDCEVVRGMPLESLNLCGTQVRDISVLGGMPLRELYLAGTRVFNFRPLQGLRLSRLGLTGCQIRDLSVLAGMPLKSLDVRDTGVNDITPLRGMPVTDLCLAETGVRDISGLEGMPLRRLDLSGCRVDDIAVLRGMPLQDLDLGGTGVSDLGSLAGMDLTRLNIDHTDVRDLTPLRAMPLRTLQCRGLRKDVDYRVLARMQLHAIYVDMNDELHGILRSMPRLTVVNGQEWKRW